MTTIEPRDYDAIFQHLNDRDRLITALMYEYGLSLSECLQLRIGDIDTDISQIDVRNSNGIRQRCIAVSAHVMQMMVTQLSGATDLQRLDAAARIPVALPARITAPDAGLSPQWGFVFPGAILRQRHTGYAERGHLHGSVVRKKLASAATMVLGESHQFRPEVLRRSFAVRNVENGTHIARLQLLLGHTNLTSTIAYINNLGYSVAT